MNLSNLGRLPQQTAIYSIDLYQHHLSPRKGFACPHRLLHGGPSCSDYVKQLLHEQSLTAVMQLSVQRFRHCHTASRTLRHQQAHGGCLVIPCCIPI